MDLIFSKQNMEVVLDYVGEGMQIIDHRGHIIYYNRAVAALDDINKEDTLGKHILQVYPSLSHETSTLLRAIQTGMPTVDMEQTFINYKGKKITTVNSSFPIKSRNKIIGAIEISRNITDVRELSERVMDLQEKLFQKDIKCKKKVKKSSSNYSFVDIIGQSLPIAMAKNLAMRAAKTPSPVFIYGETGTGKELFVHAIHTDSPRKDKPFIAQNCGALPATLLESILFGTVKGSFTGADDRPGLFELADGGTLFLDEINSMPVELQVKLLRVLQDGTIRRVGDIKTRHVDVRIIAASNVDPMVAMENRQLRRDLYYRLNVVALRIPELKERDGDIPLLTQYFIDKFNKKLGRAVRSVSRDVMELFKAYDWPGNVRELEHAIEGAMNIMDGREIEMDCLPFQYGRLSKIQCSKTVEMTLKDAMENLEREMIQRALQEYDGNISHAADNLGIPRQTLQYKIKKYGVQP